MDFNKRWQRELRFNLVMLGLSSMACLLTALVRDRIGLPDDTRLRISQQLQTADAGSSTAGQFRHHFPR